MHPGWRPEQNPMAGSEAQSGSPALENPEPPGASVQAECGCTAAPLPVCGSPVPGDLGTRPTPGLTRCAGSAVPPWAVTVSLGQMTCSLGCAWCSGLHAAAGTEAVLQWPELHVNLSCSCLTCFRGWRQPLTHPGALTVWPQGQRVNPAQPLRDQSARPRSPREPWVAPVSSLPRGGPGQTMAGRRPERDGHGLHSHLLPLRLAPRCSVAWPLCLASSQGYKDLCLPLPYGPGS